MQAPSPNLAPVSGRSPELLVVCLVGFMGCGKTTVGALLARQLAWRFEDLDQRVEENTHLGIPAIFERFGEAAFRRMEADELSAAICRATETREPVVLALGGGTYAQPGVVQILRAAGALVIWLDCPVEMLLTRCVTMTNRPLFRDESSFRALLASRLPFYQQADFRVTGDDDPVRVAERILALPPFAHPAGFAPSRAVRTEP